MKTVTSAVDLVTPRAATVEGFRRQCEEKFSQAGDYLSRGRSAITRLQTLRTLNEALEDPFLHDFVLAAASLSMKSQGHLSSHDKRELVVSLIEVDRFGDPNYQEELLARFLLSKGDALGGSLRNSVGQTAQRMLTESVLQTLAARGIESVTEMNMKGKVTAIQWTDRRLIFDKKPRFVGKSIDFIVHASNGGIEDPSSYLCCGELKGGIDPAGADEHWKTARTALDRVRNVFKELRIPSPNLFFVGSAIVGGTVEGDMANEIFGKIKNGELRAAANLNKSEQMDELVEIMLFDSLPDFNPRIDTLP